MAQLSFTGTATLSFTGTASVSFTDETISQATAPQVSNVSIISGAGNIFIEYTVRNLDASTGDVYSEPDDNTPDFFVDTLVTNGTAVKSFDTGSPLNPGNTTIYAYTRVSGKTDSNIISYYFE